MVSIAFVIEIENNEQECILSAQHLCMFEAHEGCSESQETLQGISDGELCLPRTEVQQPSEAQVPAPDYPYGYGAEDYPYGYRAAEPKPCSYEYKRQQLLYRLGYPNRDIMDRPNEFKPSWSGVGSIFFEFPDGEKAGEGYVTVFEDKDLFSDNKGFPDYSVAFSRSEVYLLMADFLVSEVAEKFDMERCGDQLVYELKYQYRIL